jgi:uncharacterized protein
LLFRLLIFFLLAYVFYTALKAYWSLHKSRNSRFVDPQKADDMVLDPQCQTYVPKREAIVQQGKYFCSRECARLFLLR